jgi:hypothetical protein
MAPSYSRHSTMGHLRNAYLLTYNLCQTIGWLVAFYQIAGSLVSRQSLASAYSSAGYTVCKWTPGASFVSPITDYYDEPTRGCRPIPARSRGGGPSRLRWRCQRVPLDGAHAVGGAVQRPFRRRALRSRSAKHCSSGGHAPSVGYIGGDSLPLVRCQHRRSLSLLAHLAEVGIYA